MDTSDTSEDTQLALWIKAAREYGEIYTQRAFATQTWEYLSEGWPCNDVIEMPKPPMQSVTSVKYKDSVGIETTLTANTDYLVDNETDMNGRIMPAYGKYWPSFTPYPVNPIRIRFVAGYDGTTFVLPTNFKAAMLIHVGLFYKYRDCEIPKDDLQTVNRLYYSRRIFNV
jgi:uncharacterized phiE125 gp8 family phage protein